MSFDLYFFNLINNQAGRQKWLDFLGVFFARYLAYLMVAYLAIVAFVLGKINILILPVAAGLFSRFIINEIIYFFYKRKRPSEVLAAKTLVKIPGHPSFPSGHVSFFSALSFALFYFSAFFAVAFLIFSALMGFSRVFAGVHWPSDISAGFLAGGISAVIIYNLFLWILSTL